MMKSILVILFSLLAVGVQAETVKKTNAPARTIAQANNTFVLRMDDGYMMVDANFTVNEENKTVTIKFDGNSPVASACQATIVLSQDKNAYTDGYVIARMPVYGEWIVLTKELGDPALTNCPANTYVDGAYTVTAKK